MLDPLPAGSSPASAGAWKGVLQFLPPLRGQQPLPRYLSSPQPRGDGGGGGGHVLLAPELLVCAWSDWGPHRRGKKALWLLAHPVLITKFWFDVGTLDHAVFFRFLCVLHLFWMQERNMM